MQRKGLSRAFVREGRVRLGWTVLAALLLYAAAAWGAARGLGALRGALFARWSLTAKTLPYAPGWMRALVSAWGALAATAQGVLGLLAVALCARLLRKRPLAWAWGHVLPGAGIGSFCALAAFALLRLADGVRSLPSAGTSLSFELAALAAAIAGALAPEALVGGLLWPEARRMDVRARLILFALLDAAMYVLQAPPTALSWGVVLAMALCCAVFYERRGWLCAAALRAAWRFVAYRLCGFSVSGIGGAFLETFPAGRDWLSGGDLGLEAGAGALILFLAAAALSWFGPRPRKNPDRRPDA